MFGKVWTATLTSIDGETQEVAVKSVKDLQNLEPVLEFFQEISVLKVVSADGGHRNVVALIGVCTQTTPLLAVLELATLGGLKPHLAQVGTLV